METAHYYEVNVDWMNTRMGNLTSPVLNTNIEVATPPEFNEELQAFGTLNIYWLQQ